MTHAETTNATTVEEWTRQLLAVYHGEGTTDADILRWLSYNMDGLRAMLADPVADAHLRALTYGIQQPTFAEVLERGRMYGLRRPDM